MGKKYMKELFVFFCLNIAMFIFSIFFNLYEILHKFFHELEHLLPAIITLCLSLMVFSFRRWKEIIKLNKSLSELSFIDDLTNLYNRRAFYELGQKYILNNKCQHFSILFLDLDGFKNVNDQLGHEMGDMVLKDVSKRLKNCISSKDIVARLGGDEFIILLTESGRQETKKIAKQLLEDIKKPFSFKGENLYLTTSIGISQYPSEGKSIKELVMKADQGMYLSKKQGKNTYYFFE